MSSVCEIRVRKRSQWEKLKPWFYFKDLAGKNTYCQFRKSWNRGFRRLWILTL